MNKKYQPDKGNRISTFNILFNTMHFNKDKNASRILKSLFYYELQYLDAFSLILKKPFKHVRVY